MTNTITKTVNIVATPEKVFDYVSDLSRWAEWSIVNVKKVKPGDDGFFLMEGPRGVAKVKMYPDKAYGLLDHDFIDPAEGHWIVPCRVVGGSKGAHFMITFTKPARMDDEAFETGMKLLDKELAKLKEIMENK